MEDVPLKPGASTLVKLGAIQGMILALCAAYHIPVVFLSPTTWRSKLGLFDGTRSGTHRDEMKHKAICMANDTFGTGLKWVSPTSKKNQDDVAEAILIAWSQIRN